MKYIRHIAMGDATTNVFKPSSSNSSLLPYNFILRYNILARRSVVRNTTIYRYNVTLNHASSSLPSLYILSLKRKQRPPLWGCTSVWCKTWWKRFQLNVEFIRLLRMAARGKVRHFKQKYQRTSFRYTNVQEIPNNRTWYTRTSCFAHSY